MKKEFLVLCFFGTFFTHISAQDIFIAKTPLNTSSKKTTTPFVNEDSDNDGILDKDDLDDDNDGILDTDECDNVEKIDINESGVFTRVLHQMGTVKVQADFLAIDNSTKIIINGQNIVGGMGHIWGSISSGVLNAEEGLNLKWGDHLMRFADNSVLYKCWVQNSNGLPRVRIVITENGVQLMGTRYPNSTQLEPMYLKDGDFVTPTFNAGDNEVILEVPDGGGPDGAKVDFQMEGNYCKDTDGDGIVNRLDLDSDNDGCPDAIEGTKNITNEQLNADNSINSGVDANGVPTLVGGSQGVGNSQKATKIEVLEQPQNFNICIGKNATFSAKAKAINTTNFNGGNPNYANATTEQVKYQWQKYNTINSQWEDITNKNGTANSNAEITLDLGIQSNMTNNGSKYRVKITSESMRCPTFSNEATLTINTAEPTFTKPNDVALCVNNIITANFANTTNGDVNTPPDYYEFTETSKTMLDIININSNCCTIGNTISWKITPTSNGQSLSGTGQPSASLIGKKLWLNVATSNPKSSYIEKQYTITYKVTDCNGNESEEKSTTITIKPRPKIDRIK
ncbi:MAG: hypothetical protein KGV44_05260 [Flavobacteriaceae bacterium]|nr:hypothetical protein [Flavobacteriaceae bacterium]